jgi:hypothetical protein
MTTVCAAAPPVSPRTIAGTHQILNDPPVPARAGLYGIIPSCQIIVLIGPRGAPAIRPVALREDFAEGSLDRLKAAAKVLLPTIDRLCGSFETGVPWDREIGDGIFEGPLRPRPREAAARGAPPPGPPGTVVFCLILASRLRL